MRQIQVRVERLKFDAGGHYARPDVFSFAFSGERARNVNRVDEGNGSQQ